MQAPSHISAAQTKDAAPAKVGYALVIWIWSTLLAAPASVYRSTLQFSLIGCSSAVVQAYGKWTKAFPSQPFASFQCTQLRVQSGYC